MHSPAEAAVGREEEVAAPIPMPPPPPGSQLCSSDPLNELSEQPLPPTPNPCRPAHPPADPAWQDPAGLLAPACLEMGAPLNLSRVSLGSEQEAFVTPCVQSKLRAWLLASRSTPRL